MGHHVSLSLPQPFQSQSTPHLAISIPPLQKTTPYYSLLCNPPPTNLHSLTSCPNPIFQSSTAMAALAHGRGPALLHRQYEPLPRHLHGRRRPVGPAGRRQRHHRARGSPVPSNLRLGRRRDRKREVVSVDVSPVFFSFLFFFFSFFLEKRGGPGGERLRGTKKIVFFSKLNNYTSENKIYMYQKIEDIKKKLIYHKQIEFNFFIPLWKKKISTTEGAKKPKVLGR